jgi:hypothetical protein
MANLGPKSFIELQPMRLSEESAQSIQARIKHESENGGNCWGLGRMGVTRFIADNLPAGLDGEALTTTTESIAEQIGWGDGAGIAGYYQEFQERK